MAEARTTRPRRYTKLIGAASALAALVAFGSANAATEAQAVTTNTTTNTSTSPELFPHSSFDHFVVNQPASADSSNYVNRLVSQYATNYGSIGVNQMPIFTVPANQPLVPVSLASGCYGSFLSTLGNGVPIPPGAYNTNSSDDDIIISQPSTGRAWELWQATQTNGQWSACWGGGLNLLGSTGVFPAPYGLSATGISYLTTTITETDVASGHINHAIAMQIVNCSGYVAPADRGDCTGAAGAPPEGTWFRMPQSTPMPAGLTPFAQMVFRTLQTYGAVVVDHAGAVMIQAENGNDWAFEGHTGTDPITTASAGKPEYQVLNGMPWSQLQVIIPPPLSPNCTTYSSAATGSHQVCGAIQDKYLSLGGPSGFLGYPTTDETLTPDGLGRFNHFANSGSIYWTPNTGAWSIHGAIRAKWASLGWERSFLGYPVTDESGTPNGIGRFNHFSNAGSIYWTPNTGAWSIHGAIRAKWASLGWERSFLGYPVTDESGTPNGIGRFNHFSNAGSIYWTPSTGAWSIHGAIRAKWASLGWERSCLVYPVSDEFPIAGGRQSNFQHGFMTWNASTGVTRSSC